MHDTALNIGGLVMRTYCPPKEASILEIGAQDMNGSLRGLAPKGAEYIGLDFEDGKGVDIVLEPGKPWPVEDDHFDLVLASSVFEHDVAFWITFEAMCRKAKPGGHIYISAPSNGIVHRCPQDYWRFYPDSGLALKEWAARQDLDVTLVESFIAEREADMWNDFCAVFRREPSPEPLNRNYVYQKVPCTNVIIWESNEVLNPRANSQDILLIAEAREEAQKLQAHINWREHVMAGEKSAWAGEREELVRNAAAASVAREALAIEKAEQEKKFSEDREASIATEQRLRDQVQAMEGQLKERDQQIGQLTSNLEQRRAEIEEAWSEAEEARKSQQAAEQISEDERQRVRHLGRELSDAQELIRKLSDEQQAAEERARSLAKQVQKLERTNRNITRELARVESAAGRLHQSEKAARSELAERLDDLAQLTRELVEQEEKLRWLREVHACLSTKPSWWALAPRQWQRSRELRRLARAGLFDSRAYLDERPDVRASGQHPLQHYIDHGLDEDTPNISFWSR